MNGLESVGFVDVVTIDRLIQYCCAANNLSKSEGKVLNYIAKGLTISDVARIQHISIKTVSLHKRSAYKKMEVNSDVNFIHFLYSKLLIVNKNNS